MTSAIRSVDPQWASEQVGRVGMDWEWHPARWFVDFGALTNRARWNMWLHGRNTVERQSKHSQ